MNGRSRNPGKDKNLGTCSEETWWHYKLLRNIAYPERTESGVILPKLTGCAPTYADISTHKLDP